MKSYLFIVSIVLLCSGSPAEQPLNTDNDMEDLPDVSLTILYDNYRYDESFASSWGFSCLVEGTGKTILFDTGGKDGNLLKNLKAAGKNAKNVDLVVLSHIHWDHTGGLAGVLELNPDLDIYLPASFPDKFKEEVREFGANPVEIKEARQISDFAWTSGEMGSSIIEQSLYIQSNKGIIVLTGCAHPGIESIVKKSIADENAQILLIIGGFHLIRKGQNAVKEIADEFEEMNIEYAAPTHCSGDKTLEIFQEVFGDHCLKAGAGRVIHTAEFN